MERHRFARLVKQALSHLYDHPYLQRHPLTMALLPDGTQEVGGVTLHRVLLEAIEALRPPPSVPPGAPSWRPYLVLYRRYVRDMSAAEVATELAISLRGVGREQAKGLEALTELLWRRYQTLLSQRSLPAPLHTVSTLDAEVSRLGATASRALTPLGPVVQSVVATLSGLASRRRVDVCVALPADLPSVSLERVILRQVLLNVMTHVLGCVEECSIELRAHRTGEQVKLSIMCPLSVSIPLLPLGYNDDRLVLAARLLSLQGGRMLVGSPGESTIHFLLPARQPPTVLIIDDNPEVVDLFRRYLGGDAGGAYQIVAATSGQEGLALARQLRPQVIILDVMMPTQDGWEVLQSLRNLPVTCGIPVIVCSVLRECELALSLGAADFIAKPVTQAMLLTSLARCMQAQGGGENPRRP